MSDIWLAVFDGKPTGANLPHPDADDDLVVTNENFAGWVRVIPGSLGLGAGTQRELGLQAVRAIERARHEAAEKPLPGGRLDHRPIKTEETP